MWRWMRVFHTFTVRLNFGSIRRDCMSGTVFASFRSLRLQTESPAEEGRTETMFKKNGQNMRYTYYTVSFAPRQSHDRIISIDMACNGW